MGYYFDLIAGEIIMSLNEKKKFEYYSEIKKLQHVWEVRNQSRIMRDCPQELWKHGPPARVVNCEDTI
ncbi:MAG: hypothetical protein BZ136_07580 [Methanosphaera sp. rholeuAM74]|nr:MAG: hypothetical protein BZ136_07580 [Methanosphaera sp. rholeuAM74]